MGAGAFLLEGDGGAPEGDRDEVFEDVAFFAAMVFGAGEGVVFGRHAVGEIEEAADLLGRVDGALRFMQYGGVRGRHPGDGGAVLQADDNSLDDGGAVEAMAGGFPLLALEFVESDGSARDGEFGLSFLLFGAMERGEILQNAIQGSLGGGFIAIEEG